MALERFKSLAVKACLILNLWFVFSFSGNAQLVELNLSLKRDTIAIGEQNSLKLDIVKHQKVILQYFPLKDSLNKEIEILDSLKTLTSDSLVYTLDITSFTAGQYLVPSIPLVFRYEENIDTMYSPELLLTVLAPQVNEQAEIRDIKPPLNLPFRLREIIPQTGLALGILLVLLVSILYLIRRFRKKIILEKAERLLPPHVVAFRELDLLKEEKLWQLGKIKEYYSKLSDIMRVYLEQRYNIPAMEFVSSETMHSFRKIMPLEETLIMMLEGILETSDMVKFAKADPLPAENQGNMDNAYLFVTQTKIEEILIPEEKENENGDMKINQNTLEG
jgi:hypothetical protein